MLYSICSMQFWINKSNLVCAENDLSTHLCVDCILLWPERFTAWVENFLRKTWWKLWQTAANSRCDKSSVSFGSPRYRLLNPFCVSPLPPPKAFFISSKRHMIWPKTDSAWAEVVPSLCVKCCRQGHGRPGPMVPSALEHFCSTWWPHHAGLVHCKGHTGELR